MTLDDILEFYQKFFNAPLVKGVFAFAGSMLQWLFGMPDVALKAFLTLLVIDLFTGLGRAWRKGELKSIVSHEKGRKKYTFYALVLILAQMLEYLGVVGLRNAALLWAGITEYTSIRENIKDSNWPVFFHELVQQARNKLKM